MTKKVLFFLFFLSGCYPFLDSRREAGSLSPVGQSRPERLAVCYNGWVDSPEDLTEIAQEACPFGKIQYQKSTSFSCTLFYPSTAFFSCPISQKKRN